MKSWLLSVDVGKTPSLSVPPPPVSFTSWQVTAPGHSATTVFVIVPVYVCDQPPNPDATVR
jgi:hypothetical protein